MNQFERDWIDDPPEKNPYFTKPDVANFLTPKDIHKAAVGESSRFNSLIDLFGLVDKMTDEQSTQFLLQVLRHSKFQPDFEAVANALNVTNSHHVGRRFNTIIRQHGFDYDKKNGSLKGNGKLPKNAKPARAVSEGSSEPIRRLPKRGRATQLLKKNNSGMTNNDVGPDAKKAKLGLARSLADYPDDSEEAADVEDNGDEEISQHDKHKAGNIASTKKDLATESAKIHNTAYHAVVVEKNPGHVH